MQFIQQACIIFQFIKKFYYKISICRSSIQQVACVYIYTVYVVILGFTTSKRPTSELHKICSTYKSAQRAEGRTEYGL